MNYKKNRKNFFELMKKKNQTCPMCLCVCLSVIHIHIDAATGSRHAEQRQQQQCLRGTAHGREHAIRDEHPSSHCGLLLCATGRCSFACAFVSIGCNGMMDDDVFAA